MHSHTPLKSSCNYVSKTWLSQHFRMAKMYCAQWQLNGSQCLTHGLCAIFTGFTQCDNCTIATVNIIQNLSSKLSFLSSLYNNSLFCHTNTEDNGANREKAERFTADLRSWRQLQALYAGFVAVCTVLLGSTLKSHAEYKYSCAPIKHPIIT